MGLCTSSLARHKKGTVYQRQTRSLALINLILTNQDQVVPESLSFTFSRLATGPEHLIKATKKKHFQLVNSREHLKQCGSAVAGTLCTLVLNGTLCVKVPLKALVCGLA